jgi:hypothetical protein
MRIGSVKLAALLLSAFVLINWKASASYTQQEADPNFNPKVARPAYTTTHPTVLFDEAHNNFHTADGRYKPFADLITNDGYKVVPNTREFTRESLAGYDTLVISNALGDSDSGAGPAFTARECDAVRDWVREGRALLLIADHWPACTAAENLSSRFGVEMGKGFTDDPANYDKQLGNILFSRENKLLKDHAVTLGRDSSERVNRVVTFTGQSMKGPQGSVTFLKLSDTAYDELRPGGKKISAANRAQGIALEYGKGRVVILGEAAMLTAQLAGRNRRPWGGLNSPGIDNKQLALNIMHWLSRLLN